MNNLFNDDITKSIASSVRDVLEGKPAVKKEQVKYPHDMFHPKTGEKEVANNEEEHKALAAKGYTHEKPKVNEVEEPRAKGEKDFKDKHIVKKSGEKEDGTVVKEAFGFKEKKLIRDLENAIDKTGDLIKQIPEEMEIIDGDYSESYQELNQGQNALEYGIRHLESDLKDYHEKQESKNESVNEATLAEEVKPEEDETKLKESEKQEAYKKFFDAALKKFGVDSPADLDDAKKKEFFNYIDKNYKAKAEEIDAKEKSDDEEEVQEAMSAAQMKKRYEMIKKSVEKINKQNLDRAKKDALKMMKDSGMFDESSDDNDDEEADIKEAIKAKEKNKEDYFELKKELTEAKETVAKLKPGMKLNVFHSGASARNYGVNGENVYGGKVQVLGLGNVPYGKPAKTSHVIGKDYKDVQNKYKDIWNTEEIRYGHFWNAQDRMRAFFQAIAADSDGKKVPYGHTCWLWKVIEGKNKGLISYCFISSDDRWEVTFLNKSTDFTLES